MGFPFAGCVSNAPVVMHSRRSFDHLVGAGEQGRREIESHCLRRPKVYDQFELCWLFDRELSRFCSAQNFRSLPCQLPENVTEARTVGRCFGPTRLIPPSAEREGPQHLPPIQNSWEQNSKRPNSRLSPRATSRTSEIGACGRRVPQTYQPT